MPIVSVRIPQLGEGLQESLLIEFFKAAGDSIRRDEPLYAMETDKGTIDVESPYDGQLTEWLVEEGTVQKIGAPIAHMEVAEGVEEMAAGHGPPESMATETAKSAAQPPRAAATRSSGGSNRAIPPRTRRYLREKGLQDVADQIPASGGKLTPEDVEIWLASGGSGSGTDTTSGDAAPHTDSPVSKEQLRLNYRLVRGIQICVPVVISLDLDFTAIETARRQLKETMGDVAPSGLMMVLWCITRTMQKHAGFRSTLIDEGRTQRTFDHVNLGIAVALPEDVLLTAVVEKADTLSWQDFTATVSRQVELARRGEDQATAATTVSFSNIGSIGMRAGIAAVVPPAMGTITLGCIYDHAVPDGEGFRFTRIATTTLTFDHRVVNGVGASRFFEDLGHAIEGFVLPA